jgi:hypothetical protein
MLLNVPFVSQEDQELKFVNPGIKKNKLFIDGPEEDCS